jgi:hypothetical protein
MRPATLRRRRLLSGVRLVATVRGVGCRPNACRLRRLARPGRLAGARVILILAIFLLPVLLVWIFERPSRCHLCVRTFPDVLERNRHRHTAHIHD